MNLKKTLHTFLKWVSDKVHHRYFPVLIAFMAFFDTFIFIFPIDVLLVTSIIIYRKAWLKIGIAVFLGNACSGFVLAYLAYNHLEWMQAEVIDFFGQEILNQGTEYFETYGLWAAFVLSASPFPYQILFLVAKMLNIAWSEIIFAVISGRFLKYLAFSTAAAYAPSLVKKYTQKDH